ncbi:MAG: glycosyltransferase family 4 protein [Desulfurococcaceae archaeon]
MEWLLSIAHMLAIRFADVTLTEIIDASCEDPVKLKYSKKRLPIALRFIDTEKFTIIRPIAERPYDLGFVGRFEKEKGLHDFVIAIKILYSRGIKSRVLIVGSGSLAHFVRKELQELNNVKIMSYVPHREMPDIYNKIKILVLPSRKEGVPTVLLEALACGVIPVVSKVGGMPWLIQRAGVGVLLDGFGSRFVVNVLEYLLNLSSEELNEMSQRCSRFIKEHFTLDRAVARYKLLKMT